METYWVAIIAIIVALLASILVALIFLLKVLEEYLIEIRDALPAKEKSDEDE